MILPAGETDGDAIQMAFSKKAVEDRKTWLSNFVPGTFLDSDAATISYSDFVHKVRTQHHSIEGTAPVGAAL